jgi:hypothetical protein
LRLDRKNTIDDERTKAVEKDGEKRLQEKANGFKLLKRWRNAKTNRGRNKGHDGEEGIQYLNIAKPAAKL